MGAALSNIMAVVSLDSPEDHAFPSQAFSTFGALWENPERVMVAGARHNTFVRVYTGFVQKRTGNYTCASEV